MLIDIGIGNRTSALLKVSLKVYSRFFLMQNTMHVPISARQTAIASGRRGERVETWQHSSIQIRCLSTSSASDSCVPEVMV